jgi:uncharacterized protein (DUF1810 family)
MILSHQSADPFRLQRFVHAQQSTYTRAYEELAAGEKRSHWMWFIFPQIQGLGHSAMAQRFAIAGLHEASAYLDHPILGKRLRECTSLVNSTIGKTITEIFGYPDDLKFHSSMTLFAEAANHFGPGCLVFSEALRKYFDGKQDHGTVARLH